MTSSQDTLRHVRLESLHTLRTWDTGRTRGTGMMARTCIGYELREPDGTVVFVGDDFGSSPMHADDSDEALRALLGFLTLRPGDTDAEYFADYTPEQLAFADDNGEWIGFIYSNDASVIGTPSQGRFEDIDSDGMDGAS